MDFDKPKRPMSAYNYFFQRERQRILFAGQGWQDADMSDRQPHRKIGFTDLARNVSKKWKKIDPVDLAMFERLAMKDKERYKNEMAKWRAQLSGRSEENSDDLMTEEETYCWSNNSMQQTDNDTLVHNEAEYWSNSSVRETLAHNEANCWSNSCVRETFINSSSSIGMMTVPNVPLQPTQQISYNGERCHMKSYSDGIEILARTMDPDCQELLIELFNRS